MTEGAMGLHSDDRSDWLHRDGCRLLRDKRPDEGRGEDGASEFVSRSRSRFRLPLQLIRWNCFDNQPVTSSGWSSR